MRNQASFLKSHDSDGGGVWIKTDTHMHSQLSDGRHSVLELAARARRSGCQAISVTDHAELVFADGPDKYEEAVRVARLQNPELIILAGVEWNVPPWGGREHATVVVPPGPDEFRRLADFSARFDDFELAPDRKPLSAEAIEWLKSSSESGAISPLVMFEHPGRKAGSSVEAGENFRQLCTDSSIVVGFSGAPGHQKQEQNRGAYEGPVQLIDRWDPVVAEAGGVWDQLLAAGQDVWAAHAPSDFHAEQNDYWPGEFSETWVHADAATPESLLRAMQRGRFFGVHGHIVREVELQVTQEGLKRAAESGESLSVTAGSSVTVTVRGRIPRTDCFGRPNRIDGVELIVAEPRGTRTIAIPGPFVGELSAETTIPVGEGGMVIRARGRRNVAGEPDLCFYTNPVRIVSRPETGLLADLLPTGWTDRGRMAIGLTMLVLTVVAAGSSLSGVMAGGRPRTPMVREVPRSLSPSATSFPRRIHILAAAVIFTLLALYGSWVPLNFTPLPFNEAVEQFRSIRWYGRRADWAANILLFIPIGFFWMGTSIFHVRRAHWRILPWALIVSFSCGVYSIILEFSQLWFPPRAMSLNDIVCETIGGALGVLLWALFGRRLTRWLQAFSSSRHQATLIDLLLQAWLFGLFVYAVLPLDIAIHPAEIFRKWQSGRIAPIPDWRADFGGVALWSRLLDLMLFVPVGILARRDISAGPRQLRPLSVAISYGAGVVILIEFCQVFVNRYAHGTDVLTGIAGVAVGAAAARRLSRESSVVSDRYSVTGRVLLGAAAAIWSIAVCLVFCWPLHSDLSGDEAVRRLHGILRVPFAALYWGSEFNFATQIVRKILYFLPLGVLLSLLAASFKSRLIVRWLLRLLITCYGLMLGVVIEVLQTTMSEHTPDSTDVLLYGLGTVAGMCVAWRLTMITPSSE